MTMRQNAAKGFIDHVLSDCGGRRSSALLERLDKLAPWATLARPIERLPEYTNRGAGRPTWCPVVMMKCLMLAKWFNLSDDGLEEALTDRISFRKFVGLSFSDVAPDSTSFTRFRARLREAGLEAKLFETVREHLGRQGFLVREGTMVDATIIEAPRGESRPDGTSTRDTDAAYTRKANIPHHGYKAHIAVDLSGLVTDFRVTPANTHDSQMLDELVRKETKAVFADSAYASAEVRSSLWKRGVLPGILYRRYRNQAALPRWQQKLNRMISAVRARVEHPTAMLKQQMGFRRVRYRGIERNRFDIAMALIACNLKMSLSLVKAG
jgi:IS5 family transposase